MQHGSIRNSSDSWAAGTRTMAMTGLAYQILFQFIPSHFLILISPAVDQKEQSMQEIRITGEKDAASFVVIPEQMVVKDIAAVQLFKNELEERVAQNAGGDDESLPFAADVNDDIPRPNLVGKSG
ncbi:unnamed protein product [Calypogeia fissa]